MIYQREATGSSHKTMTQGATSLSLFHALKWVHLVTHRLTAPCRIISDKVAIAVMPVEDILSWKSLLYV